MMTRDEARLYLKAGDLAQETWEALNELTDLMEAKGTNTTYQADCVRAALQKIEDIRRLLA